MEDTESQMAFRSCIRIVGLNATVVTNVKLVADDVAMMSSQSLIPRSVLRFSKEVQVDESTSRTEPGGGAPGNYHPQGLPSGTRYDGGHRQSSRERSTLRHNKRTACDLTSMTRPARLGLTLEVSVVTCVIPRSPMKS